MSIYGTIGELGIRRFGDEEFITIYIQAVPPHIDDVGPAWFFLPPPVDPEGDTDRAVFFVERGENKGTDRCGQEYVRPLLTMTGAEYEAAEFRDILEKLEAALDHRYGPKPSAIYYSPDGQAKKIFPPPT